MDQAKKQRKEGNTVSKVVKRVPPVMLAIVTLITLLTCNIMTASAVSVGQEVTFTRRLAYRGGQQSGEDDTNAPGNRGNHYNNRPYWHDGWSIDVLTVNGSNLTTQYGGKTYAYCIQPGAKYDELKRVVEGVGADGLLNSTYWRDDLNETQRQLLRRLMPHAFPAKIPGELGVGSVDDAYAATQVIIREIVLGYRDANGNLTNGTVRDQYLKYSYNGYGHNVGEDTPAMTAYNNISNALVTHSAIPSMMGNTSTNAPIVKLNWNSTNNRYEATLTDGNGVLTQFKDEVEGIPKSLHVERSGNTLTLYTDAVLSGATLTFEKDMKRAAQTGALAVMANKNNNNSQHLILAGVVDDPVRAYMKVATGSGTLHLIKTTTVPGGKVSGIEFGIQCPYWNGGKEKVVTTNYKGEFDIALPANQTYTIREITTFEGVKQPAPKKVTIREGEDPTPVSFENKPDDTDFTVCKEDLSIYNHVANIPFRVGHTTSDVDAANWFYRGKTDENGEMSINANAVTQYYRDMLAANDNNPITTAGVIYRDVFGKTYAWDGAGGPEATKWAVIYRAAGLVNSNKSLFVANDSGFAVTELGWAMKAVGIAHPEYYEVYNDPVKFPNQEYTQTVYISDGGKFTFKNHSDNGQLLILKEGVSQDEKEGIPFLIEMLDEDKTTVLKTMKKKTGWYSYKDATGTTQRGYGIIALSSFTDLAEPGWYRITEDPDWCKAHGYKIQEPQTVYVEPNTTTRVTFENVPEPTPVSVCKTSDDGVVEGFHFTLNGTTTWPERVKLTDVELISNAKGQFVYPADIITPDGIRHKAGEVLALYPGNYTIDEVLTAAQKLRYEQPQSLKFTVARGTTDQTIRYIHNKVDKSPVPITKVSPSGVVDGFDFVLTGKTDWGEAVGPINLRSEKNGKVFEVGQDGSTTGSSVKLWPGTYSLKEILTPNQAKLWVPKENPITFTVKDGKIFVNGTAVSGIEFENDGATTPVPIKKISEDGEVGGFAFTISGKDAMDGTVNLDGLISDDKGNVQLDGKNVELYDGTYTLTEILTPKQAALYEQPTPVTFEVRNGIITVLETTNTAITKTVVTGIKFRNVPLGSLTVHKTDVGGKSLAGAEYLLEYSADSGKTWNPVTAVQCTSEGLADGRLVTGEDGIACFTGLSSRYRYRLTETKAPEGCSLVPEPIFEGTLPVELQGELTRDPTITVIDDKVELPPTGERGVWPVSMGVALAGLTAVGGWLGLRRRKKITEI